MTAASATSATEFRASKVRQHGEVWPRINHWDSSQGRRARLRVATSASLPSVSQVGEPQPPLAPTLPALSPPQPPSSSPQVEPQPSSPCTPHRCQGCVRSSSRLFVGSLPTRGSANRDSPHGSRSCLSTSFSPFVPLTHSPCFHQASSVGHLPFTFSPCCSASTSLS